MNGWCFHHVQSFTTNIRAKSRRCIPSFSECFKFKLYYRLGGRAGHCHWEISISGIYSCFEHLDPSIEM